MNQENQENSEANLLGFLGFGIGIGIGVSISSVIKAAKKNISVKKFHQ